MIGEIVRGAVQSAAGWVGSLIAGEPGRVAGSKLAGSLMEKLPGDDSGFEPISTVVQPQSYGGRMGFSRPGMSKSNVGMAKVANAETIHAAWDRRFTRYYDSVYKVKRTVTSLKA